MRNSIKFLNISAIKFHNPLHQSIYRRHITDIINNSHGSEFF